MSEDSGPFCRHWSDPADCDLCREEDDADAALLARWGISDDNPRAPLLLAVGRVQQALVRRGAADLVVDGLWGPASQRALEVAAESPRDDGIAILRDLVGSAIAAGAQIRDVGPFLNRPPGKLVYLHMRLTLLDMLDPVRFARAKRVLDAMCASAALVPGDAPYRAAAVEAPIEEVTVSIPLAVAIWLFARDPNTGRRN